MAGFGAAVNTGGVGRGDSVAVIGCGGVGNAAIAGASVAGATTIIAVDVDDRKLEAARGFGATHTVNSLAPRTRSRRSARSPAATAPTSSSRRSAGPRPTSRRSTPATSPAPSCSSACRPPTSEITLPLIDVFGRGGALKSSWYGDCLPSRDFPMLVDLYRQGRFDLDAFVTERIGIGDVEAAFDKMHRGEVLRSVVVAVTRPVTDIGMPARLPGRRAGRAGGHLRAPSSSTAASWEVDNNVWVVGDDTEVRRRRRRPRRRRDPRRPSATARVVAVVCTHGHNDHVNAVGELVDGDRRHGVPAPGRPGAVGPEPDRAPRRPSSPTAQVFTVGDVELRVLHTPGHAPGACCLYAPALGRRCSPATPCSTAGRARPGGRSRDFPTIVESIRDRLLDLPADTVVLTGHGDATTIGAEAPHLQEWITRGH